MSSSNNFLDVHLYDGHLIGIFKPLSPSPYSMEEKKHLLASLIENIQNPVSASMVQKILHDMIASTSSNVQIENKLDCVDILVDILTRTNLEDVMDTLVEQLCDMNSLGTCPSGRCTRLLQIWLAFVKK